MDRSIYYMNFASSNFSKYHSFSQKKNRERSIADWLNFASSDVQQYLCHPIIMSDRSIDEFGKFRFTKISEVVT